MVVIRVGSLDYTEGSWHMSEGKNNYGVEWQDENGNLQWKEAQYLAELWDIVRDLLGSGVRNLTVCRLMTKG